MELNSGWTNSRVQEFFARPTGSSDRILVVSVTGRFGRPTIGLVAQSERPSSYLASRPRTLVAGQAAVAVATFDLSENPGARAFGSLDCASVTRVLGTTMPVEEYVRINEGLARRPMETPFVAFDVMSGVDLWWRGGPSA
jgi:hypothetical protein